MTEREIEGIKLLGNSYLSWQSQAMGLFDAAMALENAIKTEQKGEEIRSLRLVPVYLMITGLCIECLFKAIWVKNGGRFINDDGKLIRNCDGLGHNLIKLAQLPGVSFPFAQVASQKAIELSVLNRLQKYVEYGVTTPNGNLRTLRNS